MANLICKKVISIYAYMLIYIKDRLSVSLFQRKSKSSLLKQVQSIWISLLAKVIFLYISQAVYKIRSREKACFVSTTIYCG